MLFRSEQLALRLRLGASRFALTRNAVIVGRTGTVTRDDRASAVIDAEARLFVDVEAITLLTVFWEASYPALVWPRLTRPLVLAMAVLVHLGIGLAMGMMEFGLAMIVANAAFVPAWFWGGRTVRA